MNTIKKTLILCIGCLAVNGNTYAAAIANAYIDVSDARFVDRATGNILGANLFQIFSASNTSDVSSSINGSTNDPAGVTKNGAQIAAGNGGLDQYSTSGTGGIADNAFTPINTTPPSGTWSVSDTFLSGNLLNFTGSDTGADAKVYDGVSLLGTSTGTADANISSSSSLAFTAAQNLLASFKFTLSDFINIWTDGNPLSFATANGAFNASLRKTDANGNVNLLPTGKVFEFKYDIGEIPLWSTSSYGNQIYSSGPTDHSIDFQLIAGQRYAFTLSQDTYATAGSVPEPASLALLGIGALGLGLIRRRPV